MGLTALGLRQAATRWGWKVGLSVLDQGLFSTANFALSVLLARWLPLNEYGAFSVAFSVFLFLGGFHSALLSEPMAVLGVGHRGEQLGGYLGGLTRIHVALTGALSLAIAAGSLAVSDEALRESLWGLALAMPAILLYWLLRRAFYLETRPGEAALSSLMYAAVLAVAVAGLWRLGGLSPLSGYLAMGLASIIASGLAFVRWRLWRACWPRGESSTDTASVLGEHWSYGRWMIAGAALSIAATQAQVFVTAALVGLEGAGVLRAVYIFMLPMAQTITALGILGLPLLSDEYARVGPAGLRRRTSVLVFGLAAAALAYEVALAALGGPLEALLYGGRFAGWVWTIPIAGLVPVFTALGSGYALALRAAQRPDLMTLATGLTVPVALASAVLLTALWGVGGAVASTALAYAASAGVCYYLYRAKVAWSGERRCSTEPVT